MKIRLLNLLLIGSIVSSIMLTGCSQDEPTSPSPTPETGTFTDNRDGKEYKWVKIGNQTWMAENLKYLPSVSPSSEVSYSNPYYYVYDYQGTSISDAKATTNFQTYGVLYNWPAAMGACPTGWHLPTDDEWIELTDYLGGESVGGGKMKETGTTHWNSPNTGASNESGFSALPGGYIEGSGFNGLGRFGQWWSGTEGSTSQTYGRYLGYGYANVDRWYGAKLNGFSVRCVKD